MADSTSTKTGGQKAAENQAQEAEDVRNSDPTTGSKLDQARGKDGGVIISADEEVADKLYDESEADPSVTLNQDVYEEFYFPDTTRPSYRLLFTKGQVVRRSQINALNTRVVEAKAAAEALDGDDAEAKVRTQIDSTTLASGTFPGVDAKAAKDAAKK